MMYGALSSENIFCCVSDECGDFEHCFSVHQIVCGSQMQVVMLQCTTSDEFHVEGNWIEGRFWTLSSVVWLFEFTNINPWFLFLFLFLIV